MSSFTEEQSELLIDLVRQYPVLYNLQHKNYFNNTIKENAWKTISEALEKPVGECKTRWKTIRDSYRKQTKKQGSGSAATPRSKYCSEKLQFLDSVSFQRGSKTNIVKVPEAQSSVSQNDKFTEDSTQEVESGRTNDGNFNELNENVDEPNTSSATDVDSNSECSSANQLLRTKRKRTDMFAEEMKKSRIQREELINKFVEKKERDPVDIFFEGVAATVKTFSPRLIVETKLSVTKLISEFELRALSLKRGTGFNIRLEDGTWFNTSLEGVTAFNTSSEGDVTYT